MRRISVPFFLILVLLALNSLTTLAVPDLQAQPVVKVVLFWTPDCPSCRDVLQNFLPGVIENYGSSLEIRFIPLETTQEINRFYDLAPSLGLTKEKMGVPMVIAGDQILSGGKEIRESFRSVVDKSLISGGMDYPTSLDFSLFNWSSDFASVQSLLSLYSESAPVTKSSGMTLASVTLVFLLLSLITILVNLIRGFTGKRPFFTVRWSQILIPILAVLGLAVAAYLSYVEITAVPAICGPVGDCNTVQQSRYALIFGVLPVGLAGVAGYIIILAAWAWGKFRRDQAAEYVPAALFGMTVFGSLYSIYLTYLEIFVIHAVCIWCITSAIVMGLLALICTPDAINWIAGIEEES